MDHGAYASFVGHFVGQNVLGRNGCWPDEPTSRATKASGLGTEDRTQPDSDGRSRMERTKPDGVNSTHNPKISSPRSG